MIELTDTHCHIHEVAGSDDVAQAWHDADIFKPAPLIQEAQASGVTRMLCVGCTLADSQLAVELAHAHERVWATIGIHPHEAQAHSDSPSDLQAFAALVDKPKLVGIGECGLDYFYTHSPKAAQEKILRFQIELALKHNLPMVFHVREAFPDFWQIFDDYKGIRGVIHSFTASQKELDEILARELYVGLNGIMTFTKQVKQLDAAKAVPSNRLLLETDAPFLTPQPLRGTINVPKNVRIVAEFLAELRGENLQELAENTTKNARELFGIS
ncbi:MAG TPA: TatD family hydrolase [Patescibacteria group bacterium]|nr:TatD family hydrolase [Patescibacteria group bacterium]